MVNPEVTATEDDFLGDAAILSGSFFDQGDHRVSGFSRRRPSMPATTLLLLATERQRYQTHIMNERWSWKTFRPILATLVFRSGTSRDFPA